VPEVEGLIAAALRVLPPERVWVNPDCGLKTRGYAEVEAALRNVIAAAGRVRAILAPMTTAEADGPDATVPRGQ
jgi:5-methyltetrahydropteroyltriglutamate--homocysteine methyltransferase